MVSRLLKFFLTGNIDSNLRTKFFNASVGSTFLQFTLSLLTFITTIVIARISGDKGFGIYSLVFTWVTLISSLALFGLDDLALKQISIYKLKNQEAEIKSFFLWGLKSVLIFSSVITICYFLFSFFTYLPGVKEYKQFHTIAAYSIPFFALIYYLQSVLKAMGFLIIGQIAEKLVQPLSFIILILLFYFLGYTLNDFTAIFFRVISFVIAAIFISIILLKKFRKTLNLNSVSLNTSLWKRSMYHFTLSTLLFTLNSRVDIIFLGFFSIAPEEIAYYNVALKFSDIALIPFLVITTVSTPIFASMYHDKRIEPLQKFYTHITRIGFIVIFFIVIIFILFGSFFLSWYGKSFQSGYSVLILLCLSKLVHVFVGPANNLLSMTGHERFVTKALLLSVTITILLHLLLIPFFSITGAALASIGGLLFFDFYLAYIGYKKTGLFLTVIGRYKN
jgi:O-antigen/teichoic acid export membrane protein